jgi:DNA-binding transcriptional regulator YiaG
MPTTVDPFDLAKLYSDLSKGRPRAIREATRLSQSDVAGAIGASRSAVASWEEGRRRPRGELAARYSSFLRSLSRLLGGQNSEPGR